MTSTIAFVTGHEDLTGSDRHHWPLLARGIGTPSSSWGKNLPNIVAELVANGRSRKHRRPALGTTRAVTERSADDIVGGQTRTSRRRPSSWGRGRRLREKLKWFEHRPPAAGHVTRSAQASDRSRRWGLGFECLSASHPDRTA
jgi:hypothetical protein